MKLQIRSRDIEVTEELRGYVERRLGFALGRFGVHIGLVIAQLSCGGVTLDASATVCRVSRTVARILDLDPKR